MDNDLEAVIATGLLTNHQAAWTMTPTNFQPETGLSGLSLTAMFVRMTRAQNRVFSRSSFFYILFAASLRLNSEKSRIKGINLIRSGVFHGAYIFFSKRMYNQQKRSEEKWVIETLTGHPEQWRKPFVRTVEKNAKCHSRPRKEGQSTVKRVGKNIDRREETDIRRKYLISQKSPRRFLLTSFF